MLIDVRFLIGLDRLKGVYHFPLSFFMGRLREKCLTRGSSLAVLEKSFLFSYGDFFSWFYYRSCLRRWWMSFPKFYAMCFGWMGGRHSASGWAVEEKKAKNGWTLTLAN